MTYHRLDGVAVGTVNGHLLAAVGTVVPVLGREGCAVDTFRKDL